MATQSARVGDRLAEFRRERGWTLEQLSRKTGVGVSTLCKVENNLNRPSMRTLLKLSHGLGLNFDELLRSQSQSAPTARRAISRSGTGLKFSTAQYGYDVFADDLADKRMAPLIMTVKARSLDEFARMNSHVGEEFVYVLEGCVEMHTTAYEPLRLAQRDGIYFDSSTPHAFISVDAGDSKILSISLGRFPAVWLEE